MSIYHCVLVASPISGCKKRNRTGTLTLTRVRIAIADSNAVFTGVISTVLLAAVRISISALDTAAVAELDSESRATPPTARDWNVSMMWSCGGWNRRGGGLRTSSWACYLHMSGCYGPLGMAPWWADTEWMCFISIG